MALQTKRVFPARPVYLVRFILFIFSNTHQFNLILQAFISENISGHIKMSFSPIDNQQIREDIPFSSCFKTSCQHLAHHTVIIRFMCGVDRIMPVFFRCFLALNKTDK